jgi:hypothetical protein
MYEWVSGRGPSAEAVERMRAHFPKPKGPMGEAWFLGGERYFFEWLTETPVAEADSGELNRVLFDIASGTNSFGRQDEWESWFRYMLPDLALRGHETHAFEFMLEPTITAFMVLFPGGLEGEYEGFREDALASLGACLTGPGMWDASGVEAGAIDYPLARFLAWEEQDGALLFADWDAWRACEPLSASLFFCLKYLREEEVAPWVESVVAIEDPYFRAALVVWLLGALDLLESGEAKPRALEKSKARLSWHNPFLLESTYGGGGDAGGAPEFLPRENRAAFVRAVRRSVTPETLLAWADAFAEDELLSESLYNAPELLFDRLTKEGAG